MAYYRLYLLNGSRFQSVVEIVAGDDAEALRIAADTPGPKNRELWCGARRVHVFAAAPDLFQPLRAAR